MSCRSFNEITIYNMTKSKIYTRGGDAGKTSLIGGSRVMKCHQRLEAYGTVDELSAHLGLLASMLPSSLSSSDESLIPWIQRRLFDVGTHLAMPCENGAMPPSAISSVQVQRLEHLIDEIDEQLPPLRTFVLPGGSQAAAQCHVCRTVCRRAERLIIALAEEVPVSAELLSFVNRLSDFLFVYARFINKIECVDEILWQNDGD